ncbi:MAG TPA: hypothetical protein VL593_02280 [Ramlibacter sp.]|nr:hypothetical protein [Ramlibacter sp.]
MQFVRRVLRAVFAIALFSLAFAAPTFAQAAHSPEEQAMVGTWYGEFLPEVNAPLQRFITVRKADGTFTLHARMYQNDKLIGEARNSGLWGISNGIYFTVTTEVNGVRSDPKLPQAINAYLVKSLKPDRFEYVHFATGRDFVVTRVDPEKAQLPD